MAGPFVAGQTTPARTWQPPRLSCRPAEQTATADHARAAGLVGALLLVRHERAARLGYQPMPARQPCGAIGWLAASPHSAHRCASRSTQPRESTRPASRCAGAQNGGQHETV